MKSYICFLSFFFSLKAFANIEGDDWVFRALGKTNRVVWQSPLGRGTPYVPVQKLAEQWNLALSFDERKFETTLTNQVLKNEVILKVGQSTAEIKLRFKSTRIGYTVRLSKPLLRIRENLLAPLDFGDRVLRPLLEGEIPVDPLTRRPELSTQVVIDPGHGGNDWGASLSPSLKEKDFTLQVAQELQSELKRQSVKSWLTRESDTFLTLSERTFLANQSEAKLFVSIHFNSNPNPKRKGTEFWILSLENNESNVREAVARENQMIPENKTEGVESAVAELRAESNFENSLQWAKAFMSLPAKIHTGPFYVLYGAKMPALLVEWAYLTNPEDLQTIRSTPTRREKVQQIAKILAEQIALISRENLPDKSQKKQ